MIKLYYLNKSFLFFSICFFIIISCQNVFAQGPGANKQELILEVSTVTSKNYTEVKSALSGISGIVLIAFCDQSKCFLLTYNPNIITSTDEILKVVNSVDPSYKTKIISNTTISETISGCNRLSNAFNEFE